MQSHYDWQYLQNQFANALINSYRRTNLFGKDHVSKLANVLTDADIALLHQRTHPIYESYQQHYTTWQKAVSFYKGETARMTELLNVLRSQKAAQWDIKIQIVYMAGTPEYMTLLPNGRTGIYDGGRDLQMQNLRTLAEALAEYPDLAALKAEVANFVLIIDEARHRQQKREQAVQNHATELRKAQQALFTILYRNLGRLMDKYAHETNYITNYFQLEIIRNISNGNDDIETEVKEIKPETTNEKTDKGDTNEKTTA